MIGENLINTEDSVPIVIIVIATDTTVNSFVKGYHAYKDLWKTFANKELTTVMEPNNVVDKHAVCVKKNNVIVG